MSIYIVLVILVLTIVYLIIKLVNIKNSIREITKILNNKVHIDTNNLITTSTNDKTVNNLANELNKDLKELRKQELQYKNGNQELQRSITNISHDIRTPLTAIKGYVDLLKKEKLNKKQKEYINIIDEKSENLISLTEQLFDYSKSLDLKEQIKKENVCINDILEDVILTYYVLFKDNNITPEINITKQKIYRNVDKSMLIRIFENVLSNAIKYTDQDIKISLLNNGKIIFSNKASSLDSTSIQKIFDRYYTVENAKKNSGVGLSIAKQLLELNGGTINAKYIKSILIIEIYL